MFYLPSPPALAAGCHRRGVTEHVWLHAEARGGLDKREGPAPVAFGGLDGGRDGESVGPKPSLFQEGIEKAERGDPLPEGRGPRDGHVVVVGLDRRPFRTHPRDHGAQGGGGGRLLQLRQESFEAGHLTSEEHQGHSRRSEAREAREGFAKGERERCKTEDRQPPHRKGCYNETDIGENLEEESAAGRAKFTLLLPA
jgi:hypothetical protein